MVGGDVHLSSGTVYRSDYASIVNASVMQGKKVEILSGVHGAPSGAMRADTQLLMEDIAAFGKLPGVTVHNTATLGESGTARVLNSSPGTVIGGFCDSIICIGNLLK